MGPFKGYRNHRSCGGFRGFGGGGPKSTGPLVHKIDFKRLSRLSFYIKGLNGRTDSGSGQHPEIYIYIFFFLEIFFEQQLAILCLVTMSLCANRLHKRCVVKSWSRLNC